MYNNRGLSNRSILNTTRDPLKFNEKNIQGVNRALKDIVKSKIHKSLKYELMNGHENSKLESDNKETNKLLVDIGLTENKIVSADLFEVDLINNIDIPRQQVASDETEEVPVSSDTVEIESEEEESTDADEEDDDVMQDVKDKNYNTFLEKYNNMIDNIDINKDFIDEYKDKLNAKIQEIKNLNIIKNYTSEQMFIKMSNILLAFLQDKEDYTQKLVDKNKKKENYENNKTYNKHKDNLIAIKNDIADIKIFLK